MRRKVFSKKLIEHERKQVRKKFVEVFKTRSIAYNSSTV